MLVQRKDYRVRRGATFIYCVVAVVAVCGIVSFGVDLGRVQLTKTELQRAADAAARYAATGLADGTYLAKAQAVAAENPCDGVTLSLTAQDVESGMWANGAFTPGGASPNAVRITARREASRGNAVPLVFAAVAGKSSNGMYGLIGLDRVTMSGNAELDSYNSDDAPYSAATRLNNGDVATNGSISLSGNAKIRGDAMYKTTFTTSGNAGVVAPGTAQVMNGTISLPNPSLPASYTNKGSFSGSGNGSTTLSSGNYYYTGFSLSGNHTLNVTGQVNIYVNGSVGLSGNMSVAGNLPGNFKVYLLNSSAVSLSGNGTLYADVYAPTSAITISGNGDFFGRAVGKSIAVSGNGGLHYDEALGPTSGAGSSTISMVK
jgi:Flp pilus assembly protein TadG